MKSIKVITSLCLFFLLLFVRSGVESDANSRDEEWKVARTRHFIINYHRDLEWRFLDKTMRYAEQYYDEITDRLGFRRFEYWLWENRAQIYIYKDKAAYLKATGMPDWSGGRAIYSEKIIESFPWAQKFFSQLLPHELGHIIFREFIGIKTEIPLWLEEGVACYQESSRRQFSRQKILKRALKQRAIVSLEKLSVMDMREEAAKDSVNLFYAQAESIVRFLVEKFGKYNFVRFCRLMRDYNDFDKALFQAYYRYNSLEDLENDWLYFLENSLNRN